MRKRAQGPMVMMPRRSWRGQLVGVLGRSVSSGGGMGSWAERGGEGRREWGMYEDANYPGLEECEVRGEEGEPGHV